MATSPILWLDADLAQQEASHLAPRRALIRPGEGPEGEDLVEKHPQFCSDGDAPGTVRRNYARFTRIVRHDGHIVFSSLMSGAAAMDPNYANNQRAKHRHFGWFRLGMCPLAEVSAGNLRPDKVFDRGVRAAALRGDAACKRGKPCQHAESEIAARRALHVARDEKIAKLAMSEDAKRQDELIGAIKSLSSAATTSSADTAKMVAEALAAALAQLAPMLAGMAAPKPAEPAPVTATAKAPSEKK